MQAVLGFMGSLSWNIVDRSSEEEGLQPCVIKMYMARNHPWDMCLPGLCFDTLLGQCAGQMLFINVATSLSRAI